MQCRFLCKQRCVHQTPNPHAMSRSRTRDFSRAVFHSLSCQRLSHAQHVHVAQGPHGSSVVSSQKHSSSHLVQHGTQYTFSDDPTIIEHFSLALQSALRPDPSTGLLQISSSDEIYFHDDLINVSFGLVADLHSPTGWENNDLAEGDNPVQFEQLVFRRRNMTSTHAWFRWKHRDFTSWIGFGRWAYGPCWFFTTVFTRATRRHANIRENRGSSLGKLKSKFLISAFHAMKFEDRSQEEIERQQRRARGDAWRLA